MKKISLGLLVLMIAGNLVWDKPAIARLTPDDEAAVPPEIFKAYADVGQHRIYVCPRSSLKKADRQLVDLREKIRLRYRLDFDSMQDDEQIVIPTHCPSPGAIPDFHKRVKAYAIAINQLDEVVSRYPSPVDEELEQENAATRFLILKVLNRIEARRVFPVCINGGFLGIDAQDLERLKRETVEASVGPVDDDHHAEVRSLFFTKNAPGLPAREFDPTRLAWGKMRVRPATVDECSSHLTYRIHRPLIRGDRAVLSGINVHPNGSTEFVVVAEKSDGEWAMNYYRPFGGYSEGRPIKILQGVPLGGANDQFYLLEGSQT